MHNLLLTKCLIMKTYPFVRVLINLHWLLLIIVIGLFTVTISTSFFVEKPVAEMDITGVVAELPTLPPELSASVTKGKKLFRTNCATCHNKNMKSDMTGPALAGVKERWSAYPESDLYAWIKNAPKLIESGHPKAVEVFTKYKKVPMTAFNNMKDEEVAAILDYIESVK